jgi:putative ABC transport system permease protein
LQERAQSIYLVLHMKGRTDPSAAVRHAVAKFDPGVALYDVGFMDSRVADSLNLRRFTAFLLNALAIAGMILAAVGLYGSLAHLVELRRREIGVRIALGSTRAGILRLILVRALVVVAAGLAVGSILALIAGFGVRAQLFGVTVTDPVAGVLMLGAIVGIAAASISLPAWRAASIDPVTALRHE